MDGGERILIDASLDCRQQLLAAGLKRLDAVLLTHPHADHVMGLDDLRVFNFRQRRTLPVFGNAETLAQVRRTFWYAFEPTQYEEGKPKLDLVTVEGPFLAAGQPVVPVPIQHGSLEILGYRFGSFAYVTDALSVPEASADLLRGLDLLVLNALRDDPHPTHQSLSEALDVIERVKPRRAVLTHVGHWLSAADIDRRSPAHVSSAHDGMVFEIGEGGEAGGTLSA